MKKKKKKRKEKKRKEKKENRLYLNIRRQLRGEKNTYTFVIR